MRLTHCVPGHRRGGIARSAFSIRPLAAALLLLSTGQAAVAVSTAPLPDVPVQKQLLGPRADTDLMEAVFHEGVALYDAGNYRAAVRAWQAPAEHGHSGAQFSLGVAHATGKGVPQSFAEAVRWWVAAGAQGHIGAQLNLGLLYWRGEGVEKDLAQARLWWQRAASGGDPAAQFHLGALAATGEGGPRDYKEAARWWKLSAAQGYRQAIKGLEILKSNGAATDEN